MKNNYPAFTRSAFVALATGFLCCSSLALAEEKPESAPSSPAPKMDAPASTMTELDRKFVQTAAKDGMKEVHMGQMAVKDGQSDEVKKLGAKIVADHTKANNQLTGIAEKKGLKLDLRHKMDKMTSEEMKNFDQAWLGMMVTDHEKDIAAFEEQAKKGGDPEIKEFAKKTLPVLKGHLKMVKAAQSKMTAKKSS